MSHQYSLWQERLYKRLFEQPYPLWVDADGVLPAVSLWFLLRERLNDLRDADVNAGDRVVFALPPDRHFLAWMLAALWQGCTLVLVQPSAFARESAEEMERFLSAKVWIDTDGLRLCAKPILPTTPEASFLLATSGTTTAPKWVALSECNIWSVIDSHLPVLGLRDSVSVAYSAARVLSLLPMHHAFGLVIDFLTAFFAGAEIVRDRQNGRDISHFLRVAADHNITHCSMVPLLAERLAALPEGRSFLRDLQGGVIGGAPVSKALATFLAETRLRVGYGQTEAAPGIALGEAGVWCEHYLGKALGCKTRVSTEGVLEFSGANAHIGIWTEQGLERLDEGRWISTGDYVRDCGNETTEEYIFVGRVDETFKLANGRFIPAPQWEELLKNSIDGCTQAMIFSLSGTTCTICLALQNPALRPDAARQMVLSALPIPAELLGNVHIFLPTEWRVTPKGSTDRKAIIQHINHHHV